MYACVSVAIREIIPFSVLLCYIFWFETHFSICRFCLPMTRSITVFVDFSSTFSLFFFFFFYPHSLCLSLWVLYAYVWFLCVKSVFWICSDKSIWRELYLLFVPIHSFISSSHWILLSNIQLNLQAVDQYQYAHMDSMLCIHFQWYFVFCVFFRSVFSIHW